MKRRDANPVFVMAGLLPRRRQLLFVAGLGCTSLFGASDTDPLKVAVPGGVGPLALPNLQHRLLGSAFVSGAARPDLFVTGTGGPRALYLCRWRRTADDGAPIFAPPIKVKSPFSEKGALFSSGDGRLHAVWIDRTELVDTVFDREALAFREVGRLPLAGLPGAPQSLALVPAAGDSVSVVFELPDGVRGKDGDAWSENWRPYNAAGIWTGGFPYHYLFGGRLTGGLRGPLEQVRQVSATRREVYLGVYQIAPVNLGRGHGRDLITGSRQGIFVYYPNHSATDLSLGARQLVAGEDGNALRHPNNSMGVVAYPRSPEGPTDLVAGGEGALAYYEFTGRFLGADRPVFRWPIPVRQEDAEIFAGTLPVPSVVDWDGDGVLDVLAGNSEGLVLFLRNLGTNEVPRLLPGIPVEAGGRVIRVEAGYSGSIQGVQEARWGYTSPNVVDWNEDGRPDIVMGDITGNITVYLNRGTKRAPQLEVAQPLYCDGLNLHGMWRVRPAVARLGAKMALITVDGDDHFHLYWRIDDYNVEDGGKLHLSDGSMISASSGPGGLTGRCKLDLTDWDGDGVLDLVIGTCRSNAIPNRKTGYPQPTLGARPPATALFMKNVGTNERPVFAHAVPFVHAKMGLVQAGGAHESGAVATALGGRGPNLLVGNETGRLFLLRRENLTTSAKTQPATTR